ncbi:hypothetical protein K438DRAFT_1955575 [Mycena galopus ATCC 62051]|nr:hypothetical protein K438DRAFT_1955575 [Mycena galopus ATCC 62051]
MRWFCGLPYYRVGGACTGGGVSIRASLLPAGALPREAGVRVPSAGDAVASLIHSDWESAWVNGDELMRDARLEMMRARRAAGSAVGAAPDQGFLPEVGGALRDVFSAAVPSFFLSFAVASLVLSFNAGALYHIMRIWI